MVLTVAITKTLQQRIERDKRKTGLSKSDIVRTILLRHYEQETAEKHACTTRQRT